MGDLRSQLDFTHELRRAPRSMVSQSSATLVAAAVAIVVVAAVFPERLVRSDTDYLFSSSDN